MELREFICLNCGTKGIDKSVTKNKKFCDMHCSQAYYYKKKSGKLYADPVLPCIYNREVRCDQKKCSTCGWNPDVEEQRKAAIVGG